jgi:hypothetical protein
MKQALSQPPSRQVVEIARSDRWLVYQRLQELEIPCWCLPDGSLQVEIVSPLAALQLWSVVKQFTGHRKELIKRLNRCWRQKM